MESRCTVVLLEQSGALATDLQDPNETVAEFQYHITEGTSDILIKTDQCHFAVKVVTRAAESDDYSLTVT